MTNLRDSEEKQEFLNQVLRCPVCEAQLKPWRVKRIGDNANLSQCSECQLVFQNPPIEVPQLYSDHYFGVEQDFLTNLSFIEMKRWSFGKAIVPILNKVGLLEGRVLDIGCGTGALLDVLSARGFEAFGIEIGKSWEFASRRHPNRIHHGSLQSAHFKDGFFDLVTMFDVIEHLHDPVGVLREVRRILNPSGWVYILTPNILSINARLLGRHWYQYKPNEHLFYFSPPSLDNLLCICGFEDAVIEPAGVYTDLRRVSNPRVATSALLTRLFGLFGTSFLNVRFWVPSGHVSAYARSPAARKHHELT